MSSSKIRILIAESSGFSSEASELLGRIGELILADLDRQGLLAAVEEADVLWVRLRNRIDAGVMSAAKRLRVIVTPTTGLGHIDLEEADRRKIRILSLRGATDFLQDIRATAEHTIALILTLFRHVPEAVAHVQDGGWNRDLYKGRELHGKTFGIVGYGRLGRIVGQYLKAFDTNILAADPNVDKRTVEPGVTLTLLSELLRDADVVTLHVNLCDETRGFFGREQFAVMKQGAWFVNTARGELVDETALLGALHSGRLSGAALDVLCDEDSAGMQAHPLVACARQHNHLMITPHIGGCTSESMEMTELFLAKKLARVIVARTATENRRLPRNSN